MFTLEKAAQIFPETRSADVVPAITARFALLSAEDQLALIWYAYLQMGTTITVAAPAAERSSSPRTAHCRADGQPRQSNRLHLQEPEASANRRPG